MSAISLEIPVVQRPSTMLQVLMSSFITAVATLPFLAEPGFQDLRALLDGLENTICVATWQEDIWSVDPKDMGYLGRDNECDGFISNLTSAKHGFHGT